MNADKHPIERETPAAQHAVGGLSMSEDIRRERPQVL